MKKTTWIILCTILAFMVAFASPLTVLAQDPGPEETPTEMPTEVPTEEPADTTAFIVTSEGEVIEPGTEELTSTTYVAYYCTVDNSTGVATCSDMYETLSTTISNALSSTLGSGISLIINLLAGVTIYDDIDIDGTDLELYSLSIVGQGTDTSGNRTILDGNIDLYDFMTGSINITGNPGGFEIYGQVAVQDSNADVNISGVEVENNEDEEDGYGILVGMINGNVSITDTDSTENHNDAIRIYDTGAVTMDNVFVAGNYSDGIYINDTESVSMNNVFSVFNDYTGLAIYDVYGDLTIANTTVAFNGFEEDDDGLSVENVYGDTTLINVTSNYNGDRGIELLTGGNIYLEGVEAEYNNVGAVLGMDEPGYYDSPANTITVRDSTFSNNLYNGLVAFGYSGYHWPGGGYGPSLPDSSEGPEYLSGSIYLDNVTANENFRDPEIYYPGFSPYMSSIYLDNVDAEGGVITLNNVTTDENGFMGIAAFGQTIVGSHIQSNGNLFYSSGEYFPVANLFAEEFSFGYYEVDNTVTIECSQFNDNYGYGAIIEAYEVNLYGVESQGNLIYDLAYLAMVENDQSTDFSHCVEAADQISEYTDIVIEVMTDEVTGTGSITATQGLIFKLMEEMSDGQKDMLARVAISPSAAPAGTTFTFTEVAEGTPAALSEGLSYVGHSFTIEAVTPDGSQLNNINSYMELLFKVDTGFTAPAGTHLAIAHYNEETGEWDVLSTGFSNGYAYAYSALTGAYALVTVAD